MEHVAVRLDADTIHALDVIAEHWQMDRSAVVRDALRQYVHAMIRRIQKQEELAEAKELR